MFWKESEFRWNITGLENVIRQVRFMILEETNIFMRVYLL